MVNPGIISLELGALTVSEEAEEVIIPLIRTEGSDGIVSVDFSINEGTAIAGDDFISSSGTLTFASGETIREIVVPIFDDQISEIDETFSISIGNAVGAELGDIRTAIVTIADNDATELNTLAFSQAEYSFGEDQGEATITIVRTGDINDTVSVDYSTGDDYARAEVDYIAATGTLTFEPGESSKTFTVPLLEDELTELNESLPLTLSNPVGIDLGLQDTARLIIEEDDELPFAFAKEVVVSGLEESIAFDWTPEGKMLIAERGGVVKIFDDGELLSQPFIDMSEQVNSGAGKGLLGLAVHPEFPQKPYVYLGFSYDPPGVEPDQSGVGRVTRLIRVTADPNSNYTTSLPGSEVILLETPPVKNFHGPGAIHFGKDGSLFFSHGDGSPVGGPTSIENAELIQSLDNPLGKLLRIDPITGEGYSDNPFFDGNLNSIQSKIYNYGLRNPWRFTLHPETGEPFIGDVGWATWEEINTGRGVNFGWPLYEGGNGISLQNTALVDDPEFQELYDNLSELSAPIYARNHNDGTRAITMGDFYTGTTYPEIYQGALFFNDFSFGEVNAVLFDAQGNVDSITPFSDEGRGITQITVGSDSNLYFSNLITGEIGRWVFDDEAIIGTSNNDLLSGTKKNERIYGLTGNDLIEGGGGADTINGGGAPDMLDGQSGNDSLLGDDGNDTLDGGADDDILLGENDNDSLLGAGGNDTLDGGIGNDTLNGGADDDILQGQSGNDSLIGASGNDTLNGGADDDILQGQSGNDSLIGASGNDTLNGGADADILQGQSGNDSLLGGGGNDTLNGGTDADILQGQSGNDSLLGASDNDTLIGGIGNDTLNGGTDADILQGQSGNDSLLGAGGNDTLNGGADADILQGQSGNDSLLGAGGNDTLNGGADADILQGQSGNDSLLGAGGNDTLIGGTGIDRVHGGAGFDLFILESTTVNRDIIEDFEDGIDLFDLTGVLSFDDLTITQDGSNANIFVTVTNARIAQVIDTDADDITMDDFM